MNFTYIDVTMLNSKHHIQLGPDDPVSFPAVCDAKQDILLFLLIFGVRYKKIMDLNQIHMVDLNLC